MVYVWIILVLLRNNIFTKCEVWLKSGPCSKNSVGLHFGSDGMLWTENKGVLLLGERQVWRNGGRYTLLEQFSCFFCFRTCLSWIGCRHQSTSDCGWNHFEWCLVWDQLFCGSTAHPGGPADLALVKGNSNPISPPDKHKWIYFN